MTDFTYIGKSLPRPEGPDKITGHSPYVADMHRPNMLYGKILHSPLSHARILHIDTSKALRHPGVKSVITAADTIGARAGRWYKDRPILASKKVHYIGEAVAAVAAVDEETALEALELIRVEYEELSSVFDPVLAMKPESPLIHEDADIFTPLSPQRQGKGNILDQVAVIYGNADKALENSYLIHHDTYHTRPQYSSYIEPQAALAEIDASGKATLWANTKAVYNIRAETARLLALSLSRVRVIAPMIGGDFGGKGATLLQPLCLLLALKARLPVRMVLSREEEFISAFMREAQIIDLTMGVTRDGTILAIKGQMVSDTGAYCDTSSRINIQTICGSYRNTDVDLKAYLVYTNNTPRGQVRRTRSPGQIFARESHLDMLAHKLGMDSLELRLKNAMTEGYKLPASSHYLGSNGFKKALLTAVEYLKKEKPAAEKNCGWGLACDLAGAFAWQPPSRASSAWVKINGDGSATLISGVTDQGGGQYGIMAQIVAEVLSIPFESVSVVAADTEHTPFEQGTGGSGTTYRVGTSVKLAAEDARRKILQRASVMLEAPVEAIELKEGKIFIKERPERSISLSDLAAESLSSRTSSFGPIIGTGEQLKENILAASMERKGEIDGSSASVHIAEVEVEPETGVVKILKYLAIHDVGCAINPENVKSQVQGGVAFGLGYALSEEVKLEEGRTLNDNFTDYKLPTINIVPTVEKAIIEVPSKFGPYGARGMAEMPTIVVAPAIANAIYDAVGVRITELPMTAERVFFALRNRAST